VLKQLALVTLRLTTLVKNSQGAEHKLQPILLPKKPLDALQKLVIHALNALEDSISMVKLANVRITKTHLTFIECQAPNIVDDVTTILCAKCSDRNDCEECVAGAVLYLGVCYDTQLVPDELSNLPDDNADPDDENS